jgi:hypothetical protein
VRIEAAQICQNLMHSTAQFGFLKVIYPPKKPKAYLGTHIPGQMVSQDDSPNVASF